jgi:hypothetical protein
MTLPKILPVSQIVERLKGIFPEGMPARNYLVREMAAKVVFTALYVGAVGGLERWLAPRHVVRMGDSQAARQSDVDRDEYYAAISSAKLPPPAPDRWYADNSREPLRDEVIRQGLVPVNAMIEKVGVPSTSPLGRYALQNAFAALFDPSLAGSAFEAAAGSWRGQHWSVPAPVRPRPML